MIIGPDYGSIVLDRLKFRRATSLKNGSGYFLEVAYGKDPFYILTPSAVAPYGINQYGTAITVGFTIMKAETDLFCDLINRIDTHFRDRLPKLIKSLKLDQYKDQINWFPTMKNDLSMSLKIDSSTTFYDEQRAQLSSTKIVSDSSLKSIIQLSGIWIRKDAAVSAGAYWKIIQARVSMSPSLPSFAICDQEVAISSLPPPPPPPPPLDFCKIKPLKIKPCTVDKPPEVTNEIRSPTLHEITQGLSRLKPHEDRVYKEKPPPDNSMDRLVLELKAQLRANRKYLRPEI